MRESNSSDLIHEFESGRSQRHSNETIRMHSGIVLSDSHEQWAEQCMEMLDVSDSK